MRIAIVGAVAAAAPPAVAALRRRLPEADVWQLLDDRLIDDATAAREVTPALESRMRHLLDHAVLGGADAILMTCSLYAHLADPAQLRLGVPVLGPDAAAFDDIAHDTEVATAYVVSGVPLALEDAVRRARAALDAAGSRTTLEPVLALAARAASLAGDLGATVDAIAAAVAAAPARGDAIYLANYSLAFAADAVSERTGLPVITGPDTAAHSLRRSLDARRRHHHPSLTTQGSAT